MADTIRLRPHHVLNVVAYAFNPDLFYDKDIDWHGRDEIGSLITKEVAKRTRDDTLILLVPAEDDLCEICIKDIKPNGCGMRKPDPKSWLPIRYRFRVL